MSHVTVSAMNSTLRRTVAAIGIAAACAATNGTDAFARSGWSATGSMASGRNAAAAAVLQDGRVLVAGGFSGSGEVSGADLYDPATGTWTPTSPLLSGRHYTTATTLQDGRVLVAGGFTASGPTAETLLWDPLTGRWSVTGPLAEPRAGHRAVLLGNGRVLVTGGSDSSRASRTTAELYDPASGTWTPTTNGMSAPREEHQAALLPDGRVLVSGGHNTIPSITFTATADLYDPATNSFTPTASMISSRSQAAVATLPDGDVLVAGGVNRSGFILGIERWDAASGSWSAAGEMPLIGNYGLAAPLPGGAVLISTDGGSTTPIWSAATGAVTSGYASGQARSMPTLTALGDGRALLAGGTLGGTRLATAELFTPQTTRTAVADAGAFGEVASGAQAERDVTVTNTGAARLWVDGVAIGGSGAGDFAIVANGCSSAPVLAGASCTVRIRFAPSALGARTATLAFDDNAERSPAVALSGTGGPPRAPDPDPAAPRPATPKPTPSPIARVEIAARCIRPDRAGRVRIGLRVTLTNDAPLRVRVLRALGTKGVRRCPRGGTFRGRLQPVGGTVTVPPRGRGAATAAGAAPTRPAARAAIVRATRTLRLRLKPALYRVEVQVALGGGSWSKPTRRWLRVLTPTR